MISGCSGGGKSTLLDALAAKGYSTVKEPGRRIVQEELASGGSALPWDDTLAFVRRLVAMSKADWAAAEGDTGWVFFDRGLIDAASGLQHLTGEPLIEQIAERYRFNCNVFMAPPWPEIYVRDNERRHDLADALDEYGRNCALYPSLGYRVHILPKVSVAKRVDFVLATLG